MNIGETECDRFALQIGRLHGQMYWWIGLMSRRQSRCALATRIVKSVSPVTSVFST